MHCIKLHLVRLPSWFGSGALFLPTIKLKDTRLNNILIDLALPFKVIHVYLYLFVVFSTDNYKSNLQ